MKKFWEMRMIEGKIIFKDSILKYREALALEYNKGHISFEDLHAALGKEAEDVRAVQEMTMKGKKEIDKMFVK